MIHHLTSLQPWTQTRNLMMDLAKTTKRVVLYPVDHPKEKHPKVHLKAVDSGKRKSKGIDFEALSRHGYKGGLSILGVPPPKEAVDLKQDWSWSTGKESCAAQEIEETYEERRRTRTALTEGEKLTNVLTQNEKKNLSFAQKEKRKRDVGQASRGKSYVEEEKRLLRESGVYSGFDS
ncbi:uncharacterized protein LOC130769741 isoform X3 [Actinidia eriantha]|uniref:uncharacterized protein LOC130769741 isoform X3 n=1 Tax=Actinidia eriantha TaxID=165200 RepID=UPI0025877F20|nr:uncharacterized protein LOC130769741 isoform X3 [Actinidia eriantha]XP_057482973.1 uncharacterized protein LOC130769741 isoform X3 [Actinidia eriantha]